jgi:hypothetical protein
MKKLLATTAIITLMSTSAFAAINSNNGNTTNNPTANGGTASSSANGGAGGNATQGQIGINSSKNKNKNYNDNYNKVEDSGNSRSYSGVSRSGNSNQGQGQAQDASSANDISIGGDSYVEAKNVVNTAYAPTVIATSDCLGSVSGGGQGSSFGATLGFTTNSEPCNVRADANTVAALTKDEYLVKATLCQSDRIKEGFKITGEYNKYCVGAKATVKTSFFGLNKTSAYEERDVCAYPTPACKASKR